jgi:hypothetical protein
MSEVRERLEKDLAEVDWKSLRIHTQRDALILVATQLDLVEVACKVTADAAEEVGDWITNGLLVKPTADQLVNWETELDKPFRMLIAAPYILIQEVQHA